ncbi:MAG: RnfABCDGE type electron transport complex subunit D [Ruminococcus sp.]|jgi:electron transport complex protein RnfD|nr:RnfABCDGE type electron transport complex subunit D [Ruminococcus sp.]
MSNNARKQSDRFPADSLLILAALTFSAVYYYGVRAFAVIAAAALIVVFAGGIVSKISKRSFRETLLPDLVLGLIVGLMLPAQASFGLVLTASLFAALICRAVFGGEHSEPAPPAAAAYLFVFYAFGDGILLVPPVFSELPVKSAVYPETLAPTFFSDILNYGVTTAGIPDLLFGRLPFYSGGGCIILLIIAAVFFVLRRDISFLSLIITEAVFAVFALFVFGLGIKSTLFCAAALLFPVIFIIMPPARRFVSPDAKILYGIFAGAALSAFVLWSKSEAGGFFTAVLISPFAVYFSENEFSFSKLLPAKFRSLKLQKL